MIYGQPHEKINNKCFIFDEVFRNADEKEKVEKNEQYFYYRTLGKIKDKFRNLNQSGF